MRKYLHSILMMMMMGIVLPLPAQNNFKTVVPLRSVIAGEPFRVQYIMEGNATWTDFTAPVFKGFRLVAGPDVYSGTTQDQAQVKRLTNIVFTLSALQAGQLMIPGASVLADGKKMQSNPVFLEIVPPGKAINKKRQRASSTYYLQPGDNPYDKIRKNLFLKVAVDKKQTYVGQPVVATFRLYSRLESRSEIVKNPGFYGFGVHDVISITDKVSGTEMINGLPFDVHVIRKVQLYPLQAGQFIIDAMELENKVVFSNNGNSRKPEVVENMYGIHAEDNGDEETVYESMLRTSPVHITVRPLPQGADKNFNGATGSFTISSAVNTHTLHSNEEGFLTISIKGAGNFTQISAPVINWPTGIEGFEPVVLESLDKQSVPLKGVKTFKYPFVSTVAGDFQLAPVHFTFFNPASGSYQQLQTDSLQVTVLQSALIKKQNTAVTGLPDGTWHKTPIILLLSVIAVITALSLYVIISKRKKREKNKSSIPDAVLPPAIDDFLAPVKNNLQAADPLFYQTVYDAVWQYFSNRLHLSGTGLSKENLVQQLSVHEVQPVLIHEIMQWLQACEAALYTNLPPGDSREYFFAQIETLLRKADTQLL